MSILFFRLGWRQRQSWQSGQEGTGGMRWNGLSDMHVAGVHIELFTTTLLPVVPKVQAENTQLWKQRDSGGLYLFKIEEINIE